MANHLRPLFIIENFGGVPIPKVMIDEGATINLLPHRMLSKMGRTEKDLIPTRLTVTNFAGGITKTHGILDVDVIVGNKKLKIAFFVQLALWNEEGYMEIVEANPRPFLPSAMCFKARYYHDDLGPFTFLGVNQNGRPLEKDRATTIRSITKILLMYWEERKLFMQNPAINMAEFTHESTKDQEEESLQEEVLDFAPAALDNSLPEVEDPLQEINLGTEEDSRPTFISALLKEPLKSELIVLLQEFRDCFAWHYHEMPRLDRELVEHKLPIKKGYFQSNKLEEEFLKRKIGAVRICVDYRNLNEASPKDEYPMPMADMLVDGAAHNQMLSFMDGNVGYNQIMVAEEDIHKTAFMCSGHIGAFEYTVMPFGLRNTGATYQRAMNSVFHDMIGHYLEEQNFKRKEQHQQAFEEIKSYLSNPSVLSPPKRGKPFKLYVSASEVSIGSLLVQDNKEGKKQAVYYLSRTLTEVERKYSAIERLCLALYFTAVKLRHYMPPYTIYIIAKTDLIKYMLTRPMLRGRIGKWTLALTEFAFRYVPQKAVKGQAVADFLADHPGEEIENMDSLDIENADLLTRVHVCLNNPIYSVHLTPWKLYFDGSKTDMASGAGIVLEEPLGIRHCYSF
ncbi:PREDICTED: uncharacterized protein LOC107880389 [Prunus mume]|uniref:Uncharacterized protein LOC107880389 n=1 Tax=Prunus mume TaxID=102107 RepID=A0ABM1LIH4_PRUMU|nr:PREDICTED: uncharacterized protein LOC107880389 [Prunus mume]